MPKRYSVTLISIAVALCAFIAAVMFQRYGFAVLFLLIAVFGAAAYALGRARLPAKSEDGSRPRSPSRT